MTRVLDRVDDEELTLLAISCHGLHSVRLLVSLARSACKSASLRAVAAKSSRSATRSPSPSAPHPIQAPRSMETARAPQLRHRKTGSLGLAATQSSPAFLAACRPASETLSSTDAK